MIKNIFFGIFFLICFLSSCKTNREVTPYEYALLSAHVYNDGTKDLPEKFETFVVYEEKEKSLLGHLGSYINGLDVDKVIELNEEEKKDGLIGYLAMKAITTGGYYGQAYLDRTTNEVIIAHRGTENLIEAFSEGQDASQKVGTKIWNLVKDLDDDYEIYAGKIPRQQFLEAQVFTKKVKNTYQKEFKKEPKIVHTGHSLGAVLAELCAVTDNCKAITFESPGTAPLLEELESLSFGKFDYKSFDSKKADITSYNVEPNQVNTLHQHLGHVIPLYKKSKAQKTYTDDYLLGNISLHSIDSLLQRFDPKTGKPARN
jgi:lipase (class 3)